MRHRITPSLVAALPGGFDDVVKKRMTINNEGNALPPAVDEATFDAEVELIRNMTDDELELLDSKMMHARQEQRVEGGGVRVGRIGGFGWDVFGMAYDITSGRLAMTNEFGLHGHCAEHMRCDMEDQEWQKAVIIEGLIFKLDFLKTPVMSIHGHIWSSPKLIRKGLVILWSWKKFIPMGDMKIASGKYRYGLISPDIGAEKSKSMFG